MAEEIAFENGRISDFQGLVTLTLTLDRVILHTVMHHSSTSTYIPNFIEIDETFVDARAYTGGRTFETHFIRSTRRSRRKNSKLLRRKYSVDVGLISVSAPAYRDEAAEQRMRGQRSVDCCSRPKALRTPCHSGTLSDT